ncbi:MAG TPA: metallophosphoesterase family protein [Ktedonobacterales bacterium]
MRTAIISDIHGNAVALDAALADLKAHPVDQVVCLGDAIQGGPQPVEVVSRLRELGWPVVMGNADAWLLSGVPTGSEPTTPQQEATRAWSLSRLSDADRASIAGFAPTISIDVGDGCELLCFHGTPSSFDDLILPETSDEDARRLLGPVTQPYLCGGHTHQQQMRWLGESLFFNPGSVSLPYSRQPGATLQVHPRAEYAVLTRQGGIFSLEFRRVPFDLDALAAVYRASGHPNAEAAINNYER